MTSSFSVKVQDSSQKLEKSKFFIGATGVAVITLGVQNWPEIALSNRSIVFEINDIFHFRHNS